MKADIKLSEQELQKIVTDYIAAKTGWEVKGVRFNITNVYEDRPCGGSSAVLGEAVVTVIMT